MLCKILKRVEKARPAPAAALGVTGDMRDSAEGTDEGGEAPGLLDAGPGCYHHAAEEDRSMIRAQSAPVKLPLRLHWPPAVPET